VRPTLRESPPAGARLGRLRRVKLFAACLPGLEPLPVGELRALDAEKVSRRRGGVRKERARAGRRLVMTEQSDEALEENATWA